MTRSEFAAPKEPFSANDNFQELKSDLRGQVGGDFTQFSRDFSLVDGVERRPAATRRPSMVSGTSPVKHEPDEARASRSGQKGDRFANWTAKSKIGRRKVTKSLKISEVIDLQSAWHHANKIGLPVNRFITFRPADINEQGPEQRIETWTGWRNKLAQFARDHGFDFTSLWTRESQRGTGANEHMHVLMHVPRELQRRFDKVVRGWRDGTAEIDVRRCTYQTKVNRKGGPSNVLTYVSKNSPQAGRFLDRIIQLGGPIFGKRYGLSRNLTPHARARVDVVGGLRRDLGLVTLIREPSAPHPANDHAPGRNRDHAA